MTSLQVRVKSCPATALPHLTSLHKPDLFKSFDFTCEDALSSTLVLLDLCVTSQTTLSLLRERETDYSEQREYRASIAASKKTKNITENRIYDWFVAHVDCCRGLHIGEFISFTL